MCLGVLGAIVDAEWLCERHARHQSTTTVACFMPILRGGDISVVWQACVVTKPSRQSSRCGPEPRNGKLMPSVPRYCGNCVVWLNYLHGLWPIVHVAEVIKLAATRSFSDLSWISTCQFIRCSEHDDEAPRLPPARPAGVSGGNRWFSLPQLEWVPV